MNEKPPPLGILYISQEVLQFDKWIQEQAISASMQQMKKYKYLDGLLRPSPVRLGDFSLLQANLKVSPVIASFIGIPGRLKAPIIEELFVAS